MMQYTALELLWGVIPVPGDNSSTSPVLQVIDLLVGSRGFGVQDNGWIPKFPQARVISQQNGLSDGAALLGYSMPNVVESMLLSSSGSTAATRAALFAKLIRFARAAREFHVSSTQTEPVYLKWHASGATHPQYALIYNIDIAQNSDVFVSDSGASLSITIEREPYWQAIGPGQAPRMWEVQRLNSTPNAVGINIADAYGGTIYGYTRANGDAAPANGEQNFIDITAEKIPGDTRLKCALQYSTASATINNAVIIGNWPKPTTATQGGIVTQHAVLSFNGGDYFNATLAPGTDTTIVADTGAPVIADGTRKRGVVSFATTATDARRFTFQTESGVFYGNFAVFARVRLSAATTSVSFYLTVNVNNDNAIIARTPTQTLTDQGTGGTGNTGEWAFIYCGVLKYHPTDSPILNANTGQGFRTDNVYLKFFANRNSGAGQLYLADINLIPIDHSSIALEGDSTMTLNTAAVLADNTGYTTHGRPAAVAGKPYSLSLETKTVTALGPFIELEPNITNRLFALPYNAQTKRSAIESTAYNLRVAPIPRWMGIREV